MKERKFKKRGLKEAPAIVIAAFGTNTNGRVVYDLLDNILKERFDGLKILWAYTSEIIREKTGYPGILQALAKIEEEGYRRAVIQPLQIFPGTEYQELMETCLDFPGIRVVAGESLLHRWHFVNEVFDAIALDFLPKEDGINLVVAHGTPLCADPANILYIALESYLQNRYDNVFLATVDGIPQRQGSLNKLIAHIEHTRAPKKVRIIPFMYVAGIHVENDLMGKEDSFKADLQQNGITVDCPTIEYMDAKFTKALGFYKDVRRCFVNRIERSLEILRYY
ncbi:MAG: sirohydrochlorin cobaltochelatase [Nitrospirae bacterium]|uniref:sirohydrochlorin cobaltochelatase n=1 Tax=Candidatus Magnetobacterium casense TaxID=1455061 RepID=UPI00058DB3BE|nr:sirohydrochlorin cobaltochelatase [Candidatus Magnetobacterium casensis]MBF0336545.1 sirohydrochlorin cobaltochelatase [Nitrospirota bacterium]